MPYKLRKAPKKDLYWVIGPDGKHHSKDPLPKERAQAQMRALYAAESGAVMGKPKRARKSKLRGGDVGQDIADVERNVILPQFNKVVPGLGTVLQKTGDVITGLFTDQGAIDAENARIAADEASRAKIEADRQAYEQQQQAGDPNAALNYQLGLQPGATRQQQAARVFAGMGKKKRGGCECKGVSMRGGKKKRGRKMRGKGDDEEMEELVKLFSQKAEVAKPKESGRESRAAKAVVVAAKPAPKPKRAEKRKAVRDLEAIAEEVEDEEKEMEGKGKGKASKLEQAMMSTRLSHKHLEELRRRREASTTQQQYDAWNEYIQKKAKPHIAKQERELAGLLEGYGMTHLLKKEIRGAGPIPDRSILHKIALQSYEMKPADRVGQLELVSATPTLKMYKGPDNTIVVGIRGTVPTDKDDVLADGRIGIGELDGSDRYKRDLARLQQFQIQYPPTSYDYYGVGHSLGGAILDGFLKAGLLKKGVSYNPAVSVGDFKSPIANQRIYNKEDPLYQLMGRHTEGAEVRGERKKNWWEKAVEKIPYAGKAYNYFKAHQLENFTGGGKYKDKLLREMDALRAKYPLVAIPAGSERYYQWIAIEASAAEEIAKIGSTRGSPLSSAPAKAEAKEAIIDEAVRKGEAFLRSLVPPPKKFKDVGFKQELDMEVDSILARYKAKIPEEIKRHIKQIVARGKEAIAEIGPSGMSSTATGFMSPAQTANARKKSSIVHKTLKYVEEALEGVPRIPQSKVRDVLPSKAEVAERERRRLELEAERAGVESSMEAPPKTKVEFPPMMTRTKGGSKKKSSRMLLKRLA